MAASQQADPEQGTSNAEVLTRFYEAFARKDPQAMAACYAADVHFGDPVFPDLKGAQVGRMWRMLAGGGKDLQLTFRDVQADATTGSAHWEATYTFSKTGRRVHNVIEASFRFRNGLIMEHRDRFSFYRWARQALGPTGVLLGWTPLVKARVRKEAAARLAAFRDGRA